MSKTTPWFSMKAKPVRIGVYEVDWQDGDTTFFSYWDGRGFNGGWVTPQRAREHFNFGHKWSKKPTRWRGLAKPAAHQPAKEPK